MEIVENCNLKDCSHRGRRSPSRLLLSYASNQILDFQSLLLLGLVLLIGKLSEWKWNMGSCSLVGFRGTPMKNV
ncbi:hypothetical protein L2E82_31368 [Cichorium intybus]|uniref:Uncharacterized protein n=1 Tax=Cichorium intybus TaxID=13427 RepID=A0ACB9D350_CICIN|nr:hypothetical protein L2E82_31368 [Cichorium intybus]